MKAKQIGEIHLGEGRVRAVAERDMLRHRGLCLGGDERLQGFGAHQRGIPREHNCQLRASQSALCHLHGVARAVLRLLQDCSRLEGFNNSGDLLGLVADDNDCFSRLERFASAKNMLHQRASAGAVQHLRHAGLQPRAFPGCQNHNA